jgi:hypothetical protein
MLVYPTQEGQGTPEAQQQQQQQGRWPASSRAERVEAKCMANLLTHVKLQYVRTLQECSWDAV